MHPNCRGLNLESFLLKPIQRICKYPLLLKELLKATEQDHKDRKLLEVASSKIDDIVKTVNERTRQAEGVIKTLECIVKITGYTPKTHAAYTGSSAGIGLHDLDESSDQVVNPSSKWVHEGSLRVVHEKEDIGRRYVFLFTDLIIVTKQRAFGGKEKYQFMEKLMLIIRSPDQKSTQKTTIKRCVDTDSKKQYF